MTLTILKTPANTSRAKVKSTSLHKADMSINLKKQDIEQGKETGEQEVSVTALINRSSKTSLIPPNPRFTCVPGSPRRILMGQYNY